MCGGCADNPDMVRDVWLCHPKTDWCCFADHIDNCHLDIYNNLKLLFISLYNPIMLVDRHAQIYFIIFIEKLKLFHK